MFVGIPVLQLIRILAASIAPVIVISGVGLLLLSMTNRYGRVIERARDLVKDLDGAGDETRRHLLVEQLKITYRRARILRLAIILSSVSILCVTVTVLSLFAGQVLGAQVEYVSIPAFGLGLLALLGSLYYFIGDVTISLRALELEISAYAQVDRP
jgi:polyferredoxin